MKKRGDSPFSMVIVLALVCAGAGLALGATYRATRNRIDAQQERDRMAALLIVLPEAEKDGFREVAVPKSAPKFEFPAFATDGRYYEAYDKPVKEPRGKLVGYALEAKGNGYSSKIRVTVGIDPKAEIIRGIKITFQQETPGLGANCEAVETEGTLWDAIRDALQGRRKRAVQREPWFQAQFQGQRYDSLDIDGITGATITTEAVTDAVRDAVRKFRGKVLGKAALTTGDP